MMTVAKCFRIRRQFFVEFILTLPSAGLWISASVVENINHKTSLITAAVVYEYTAQYLMRSPVGKSPYLS